MGLYIQPYSVLFNDTLLMVMTAYSMSKTKGMNYLCVGVCLMSENFDLSESKCVKFS